MVCRISLLRFRMSETFVFPFESGSMCVWVHVCVYVCVCAHAYVCVNSWAGKLLYHRGFSVLGKICKRVKDLHKLSKLSLLGSRIACISKVIWTLGWIHLSGHWSLSMPIILHENSRLLSYGNSRLLPFRRSEKHPELCVKSVSLLAIMKEWQQSQTYKQWID